jgi:hypothetical protein
MFLSGHVVSLVDLFSLYLDLSALPSRFFFEVLSAYAPRKSEEDLLIAEKLADLAKADVDGADLRHEYCGRERLMVGEVLWDFRDRKRRLKIYALS